MNAKKYEIHAVASDSEFKKVQIRDARKASEYARQFYFDDINLYESVFVILLDRSNSTIGWAKISQGGITGSVCDVKIICKYAVDSLSSGVILIHNHPSGNPKPGNEDMSVTENLKKALRLLDCSLLDHIILTEDKSYSFSEDFVYVQEIRQNRQ